MPRGKRMNIPKEYKPTKSTRVHEINDFKEKIDSNKEDFIKLNDELAIIFCDVHEVNEYFMNLGLVRVARRANGLTNGLMLEKIR